jgi:hypothetical protein
LRIKTGENMAENLVYEKLEISDALEMRSITGFEMEIVPDEHAWASITGILTDISQVTEWKNGQTEKMVTVYCRKESGKEIIFSGYVMDASITHENDLMWLTIKLVSASILLDRKEKCRSFQDVSVTYADIIKAVAEQDGLAQCKCNCEEKEKPPKPVIQYRETDWQFIKRLSSHLKTAVYPEVCSGLPEVWIGLPKTDATATADESAFYKKHGISEKFYQLGGTSAGYDKSQFEYYIIEDYENRNPGSVICRQGQNWYVVEKRARIENGELLFTYKLGRRELVTKNREYNPLFAGMAILGEVLAVSGETVKLHLDIDEEQDAANAYPYLWAPDTGSVMYCMPEKGTTVSLYFSDEDEFTAKAVNCVRHNGETCSKMSDMNQRTLTTDEGKNLYLNPDSMGFDIADTGLQLQISDEEGVSVNSAKKIVIAAEQEICMSAKNVILDTPNEIVIARV